MEFKKGDRIKIIKKYSHIEIGDLGTILSISNSWFGIKFDGYNTGNHTCDGLCSSGYGYNIPQENVVLNYEGYICNPFPTFGAVEVEVVKDLFRVDININGSLPECIPKGSKTWVSKANVESESTYHIEDNRYKANIPNDYFKIIRKTSEVIKPIEPKLNYNFKEGDIVKIVISGDGCNSKTIGEIVKITELGTYLGRAGYKIDNINLDTNTKSGVYNGFIGEKSFEKAFNDGDYVITKDEDVIFIYPNQSNSGIRISTQSYTERNNFSIITSGLRKANDLEKAWLDYCIAAHKFIPKKITTKDEEQEFIVGKWYYCSCNKNIYRFNGYVTKRHFGSSAVINPTETTQGITLPGYIEREENKYCLEYFDPKKIVSQDLIEEYLLKYKLQKSLKGRYLKARVNGANGANYQKGDIILIASDDFTGSIRCSQGARFGNKSYDWGISGVELMPEEFNPSLYMHATYGMDIGLDEPCPPDPRRSAIQSTNPCLEIKMDYNLSERRVLNKLNTNVVNTNVVLPSIKTKTSKIKF